MSVTLFIPLLFVNFSYIPQAVTKFTISKCKKYYSIGFIWGVLTHLTIYLAMVTCSHAPNTHGRAFSKVYTLISFGLILLVNFIAILYLKYTKKQRNQFDTIPLALVFGYQITFCFLMIVPNFFIELLFIHLPSLTDSVLSIFKKIYQLNGVSSHIRKSIIDTDFSLKSRQIQSFMYLFSYLNTKVFAIKNFDKA